MMKIYTPKEWLSAFGGNPTLIIDDNGYIWAGDEYYKTLFGAPSGKIDFERGYLYGGNYADYSAVPIAILETVNDETKVYDYEKGRFSSPILYIKDDKIHTPDQYLSIFGGSPEGYVQRDSSSHGSGSSGGNGGTSSNGASSGGFSGAGAGCSNLGGCGFVIGMCLFLLVGNAIDSLMKNRPMLSFLVSIFAETFVLGAINRKRNPFLMRLSSMSAGKDPEMVKLCKKNAVFWAVAACIVPGACGIWLVADQTYPEIQRLAFFVIVLPLVLVLFWMAYLVIRNAMVLSALRCFPFKKSGPK